MRRMIKKQIEGCYKQGLVRTPKSKVFGKPYQKFKFYGY